jgi:large subunit ribosomal protein L18
VNDQRRKARQRQRRRFRVRNHVKAHSARPRLCVFRSRQHIYAQIIDDASARTLAAAGTRDADIRGQVRYGGNRAAAEVVGRAIAAKALAAGVDAAAFDRREYRYHGRVKALADAARAAGLNLGPQRQHGQRPEAVTA